MTRNLKIGIVVAAVIVVAGGVLAASIGTRAVEPEEAEAGADAPAEKTPTNLLFVIVDALRADSLRLYGNELKTSPQLAKFAKRAVVFDMAWAQSTYTPSSYVSYMTSTHSRTHGWDYPLSRGFPKAGLCGRTDLLTLAEALSDRAGFDTAAVVKNRYLHPKKGYPRGFHRWNHGQVQELVNAPWTRPFMPKLTEMKVAKLAHEAMAGWDTDRGHFLYLHLMTPHLPTRPTKRARKRFDLPTDPDAFRPKDVRRMEKESTEEERELSRMYYHGAVWDADRVLGHIFRSLESLGRLDDTIVVVSSDHGEKIWQHGEYGHIDRVWQELVHVPLVVYTPGVKPGRVKQPVALIDIAPTAWRLLGLGDHPSEWQGVDLFDRPKGRAVVSQRIREVAITINGRFKAIRSPEGEFRLYDLKTDPTEQSPVERPKALKRLERAYKRWASGTRRGRTSRKAKPTGICGELTAEQSKEEIEALKALGYVQE